MGTTIKLGIILCLALAKLHASAKPNIIVFLVDDMGWQETSVPFHTETTPLNRDYKTPNMEKLAADGLVLTNAYAHNVCSPSRVSLLTGANPARHRVTCWTLRKDRSPERNNKDFRRANWNLNGLQPLGYNIPHSFESVTLAQVLQQDGYRTIHAGKAHFGAQDTPGADPKNLGFEVNIAGSYMGGPGSYHGDKNFSAAWRGGGKIWDVPGLEKYHGQKINLTEAITRESIAAIQQSVQEKKPFFLHMAHYAVHAPWEADRRFLDQFSNKGWPKQKAVLASMLYGMDQSLGDLRKTVEDLGIRDNTLIIFMSDNGSPSQCPQNHPLRGHKVRAYEGGTRVPMIAYWPGKTPKGKRNDTPVIIDDIFPTLLDAAGTETIPPNDGISLVPLLSGKPINASRPLFWHYPNFYDVPPFSSVRLGNWKLIYRHTSQQFELFNLKQDLSEKNNLANSMPEKVSELSKILTQHLKDTQAVLPIDKQSNKPVPLPDKAL
ncbi:sulfatase [Verrucomicrobiaceae bacterium N1E253]|uniref:Sulfatase n=1 Tax=Oceaniferula marina TaxID=2748318 RepID=A0A851GLM8_9BACT|nr:sulfatase [Oceaniferula marina]NWK55044.1 sulfatase [Oceaniferula marina]